MEKLKLILELIYERRAFWQQKLNNSKTHDFVNTGNYKAMVDEYNSLIAEFTRIAQ